MTKGDISLWKFAFDVVQTVIMLGVTIYVWILSKHKVNSNKIAQLEERHTDKITEMEDNHRNELSAVNTELATIKTTIKHMPDKRSVHNLHERLNGQSELLSRLEGEMKGVTDNTAMIVKLLAEQGMKK